MPEIPMYRYVYSVRNVEMTLDQNYTFENGTVTYLIIRHDYLKRRFPIMQLGIEMDAEMIQKYYEHKDTALIKLDIYEQQIGENDEIVDTKLYLRGTFNCVSARDQTSYLTMPDIATQDQMDLMRTVQEFECYLIDMNIVNVFSKEISTILENCSKSAALQTLFSSRNIQPGIVIATPPQAERNIDYIALPMGDLIDNINTLDTSYGLYDAEPIIYYDYKYLYCINRLKPDIIIKSAKEFGNITLLLLNEENPEHNVVGSYDDSEHKTHYINLQTMPEVLDTSERRTSTKFATLMTVASDGTINQQTMDPETTKVRFLREYNELSQDKYINSEMLGHVVTVHTNSCCISFIKPYKTFLFEVDSQYRDKKLTGHEYRLISQIIEIRRDSPEQYIHAVTLQLQQPTVEKNTGA